MGLPGTWYRTDEWYAFVTSPRQPNCHILVTLDEGSHANHSLLGRDLRMSDDHPMIWWHCQKSGLFFYSAFGHTPEAYDEPKHRTLLRNEVQWLMHEDKTCTQPAG